MWIEKISKFLADFQFAQCDKIGVATVQAITSKGPISISKRLPEFCGWDAETWSKTIEKKLQEKNVAEEIKYASCSILFVDDSGDYGTYLIELYVIRDVCAALIRRNFEEEAIVPDEDVDKLKDTISTIQLGKEIGFKKEPKKPTFTETSVRTPGPTATPTPKPRSREEREDV